MKRIILVLGIVLLNGCTYSAPTYFENASSGLILITSGGLSYDVKPGKIRKIRGVHYENLEIKFASGVIKSFTSDHLAFLNNWQEYQGKYICSGFWGSKIKIELTQQEEVVVLPCTIEHKSMIF